jgi:hypothetical protein
VHFKATSLDDLTANMHKKLSWADIDSELASNKKIKLPDRRSLTLFNSFDIARFRGEPEMWEEEEKNTTDAQKKKIEVKEIGKEPGRTSSTSTSSSRRSTTRFKTKQS